MIKNLVTISLIIFVIIVVGILGAGLFLNQNKTNQQTNTINTTITGATITVSQVAQHNNYNDCWVIISNKVYNVTSYINMHPAGPEKIILYCGKDATTAFDTKGSKGTHSQEAQNLLNTFYVGNIIR